MAQKSKAVTAHPVAIQTNAPVFEGSESPVAESPVNGIKGTMVFDLDPKQPTSIVNGDRVVLLRDGIKSVTVAARK